MPGGSIKAVFFDVGGTLLRPYPSVGQLYAQTAVAYGGQFDPLVLEDAFIQAWKRRGGLASLGADTSEVKERAWWRSLVSEVIGSSNVMPAFDAFFEDLYDRFERAASWELYPEVPRILDQLREKQLILGVISNWDLRLPKVLANMGLRPYFDFVLGSSAVGVTKPQEKIFREALRHAKCEPEEAIHVGDSYEEDVLGADQIGINAYMLDRDEQMDRGFYPRTIKTLDSLLDAIEEG